MSHFPVCKSPFFIHNPRHAVAHISGPQNIENIPANRFGNTGGNGNNQRLAGIRHYPTSARGLSDDPAVFLEPNRSGAESG